MALSLVGGLVWVVVFYVVYVLARTVYYQLLWRGKYGHLPHRPMTPILGDMGLLRNVMQQSKLRLDTFLTLKTEVYWSWVSVTSNKGSRAALNILHPADVKHMLKDNFDNYEKGQVFHDSMAPLLGDGIFNTDGKAWKAQRAHAAHMFKTGRMREFFIDTFSRHSALVIEKHLDPASRSGEKLDIQSLMNRFTLDSIGDIAFGRNLGSLERDVPFSRHFVEAQRYLVRRGLAPPGLRSYYEHKMNQSITVLDTFALAVIAEKRALLKEGRLHKEDDVLARYLVAAKERGEEVEDQFLRDTLLNFMIAGRDTTACLLTWACYMLSQNPEAETKMVAELDEVLAGKSPSLATLKAMPFTEAVVKETLRLYPSVPGDVKTSIGEDTLPGSGVKVHKNTIVVWSAYAMGRHPDYWEDASSFKPERWLDAKHLTYRDPDGVNDAEDDPEDPRPAADNPNPKLFKKHPWQYLPFQGGPRLCLGQRMAHLEAMHLLAEIYQRFHLEHDGSPVTEVHAIVLTARDGMPMFVRNRE